MPHPEPEAPRPGAAAHELTFVGLFAEFDSDDAIVHAARQMAELGYRCLDAYTPRPVEALESVVAPQRSNLNRTVFAAGVWGAATGLGIQWLVNGVDYPLNVGGRLPFGLPAFIPITFEAMVLLGSLAAFFGCLHRGRLPWLSHPVFEIPGFERASVDRFFLLVESPEPGAREDEARERLLELGALRVVPASPPDDRGNPERHTLFPREGWP